MIVPVDPEYDDVTYTFENELEFANEFEEHEIDDLNTIRYLNDVQLSNVYHPIVVISGLIVNDSSAEQLLKV